MHRVPVSRSRCGSSDEVASTDAEPGTLSLWVPRTEVRGRSRMPRLSCSPTFARRSAGWLIDSTTGTPPNPPAWWADASILRRLGPALAKPAPGVKPTHVAGPESRRGLPGALVALELGVGLVELRKDPEPSTDSDRWLTALTPPHYQDRNLMLACVAISCRWVTCPVRGRLIDTRGQATAACQIAEAADATRCGVSVIVDALTDARLRRDLDLSSIFRDRDL